MVEIIRQGFTAQPLRQSVNPAGDLSSGLTGPGPVDYQAGWELQRAVHADVIAGRRPNSVLLLEHEAVYTAGKRTEPHERPIDGTPVIDVDRGGKITWHGPGQLVGYPIVKLKTPIDVVAYVRRMESALIEVCREQGLETTTVDGRSGVWVVGDGLRPDRKVAAIGIRVSKTATMHGFALNCNNDLSWGGQIIPCGIDDAGVTSLSAELGREIAVADVIVSAEREISDLVSDVGRDELPRTRCDSSPSIGDPSVLIRPDPFDPAPTQ